MKSENLMLQVCIPEPILRFTGLATGESHLGSGITCKYQEIKEMCRLLDIHTEILKHISEVQGTTIYQPAYGTSSYRVLKAVHKPPSDSSDLETRVTSRV